jgi:hypothetical protein
MENYDASYNCFLNPIEDILTVQCYKSKKPAFTRAWVYSLLVAVERQIIPTQW